MIKSKKHQIKINDQFVKQSNDNLSLLTSVAELSIKGNIDLPKSYREQFLKEAIDYIV